MHLRLAYLAALFALVFPTTLLADTYEYQYSGPYEYDATFTFFTSSLITSETTVTPTSCSYNPGSGEIGCDSIEVDAYPSYFLLEPTDLFDEAAEINTGFSFTQLGNQSNIAESLTITEIPSLAPTPEPSSIALLGTGMLFFVGIARRRFARRAPRQTVTG